MTMKQVVRLFRDAGWSREARRDWIEWRERLRREASKV